MGMFSDRPVDMLWWSDDKATLHEVDEMQWGADHVYSSRETIILTDTSVTSARKQVVDALAVHGLAPADVTKLPFDIDAGEATNLSGVFFMFSSMTEAPEMDTSRVSNMSGMFEGCLSLVDVPKYDMSSADNISWMFHACSDLVSVPHFDTSTVKNVERMFSMCSSLKSIPRLDARKFQVSGQMFSGCTSLERVPLQGMSKTLDLSDTVVGPDAADETIGLLGASSAKLTLPESARGCNPRVAENKGWSVDVPGTIFERTNGWGATTTPDWATAIDVVAIGGGNSGHLGDSGVFTKTAGYGGNAGKWASGSYATKPGDTVRFARGKGSSDDDNNIGGDASDVKINGQAVLTAAGGIGYTGIRYTSEGAGNYTAFGRTFIGGKSVGEGQAGEVPGGGGGGGDGQSFAIGPGGKGGDGLVWVRFRGGGV